MSTRYLVASCLSIAVSLTGAACSSDGDDPGSPGNPGDPGDDVKDEDRTVNPGTTIDCSGIIDGVTAGGHGARVESGWGSLPAAFQLVPPGGALCGSVYTSETGALGTPLIRSDLYGKPLAALYQAAATANGCTSKLEFIAAGSFNTRAQVTLSCGAGKTVMVLTDTGYDFYSVVAFGWN